MLAISLLMRFSSSSLTRPILLKDELLVSIHLLVCVCVFFLHFRMSAINHVSFYYSFEKEIDFNYQ